MVAIDGDDCKSFLLDAFNSTNSPEMRERLQMKIMHACLEGNSLRNADKQASDEAIMEFSQRICQLLKAEALKLEGNDK